MCCWAAAREARSKAMSTCVLQGGWEATFCWDAAVKAKENSSFEEAISLEFHRSWCYCSKCLIYVLLWRRRKWNLKFLWLRNFSVLTDDIKGSWKQLLTQALNFIDVKKTELSLFFFFSLIVWNYMAEGYTLNTFNVCFKTTGQVYRNYVWRKI